MKIASLFSTFLMTFFLLTSAQANYQISDDQWSFNLILDTCGDLLEEAIADLKLPKGAKVTYPETIGDQYFKIQIQVPGSDYVAFLEFEYWPEDEDYLVCQNVSAIDYVD